MALYSYIRYLSILKSYEYCTFVRVACRSYSLHVLLSVWWPGGGVLCLYLLRYTNAINNDVAKIPNHTAGVLEILKPFNGYTRLRQLVWGPLYCAVVYWVVFVFMATERTWQMVQKVIIIIIVSLIKLMTESCKGQKVDFNAHGHKTYRF